MADYSNRLSEYCGKFLKIELCFSNHPFEMRFHTLNCGLPQSSKMRSSLRDKLPRNVLHCTKFRDDALRFLVLEEVDEFFELSYSTDKICTVITPDQCGFASASDKPSEGSDEGVRGKVGDQFEMNSLDRQRDECADIRFNK